ncbi:Putative zinc-finger [Modestobacter sp. DSM 44400]|uniref:zf-HC2 domain-containing protein n=1 Tax=Modestobacter sp. DSM 44400 TaxID=1550230 RepID=UPI0008960548|nr:zf-HC2 domain-containing protein [Modestobacter sp. DSM 44400]SDY28479.1 Putative zinc-finger [Modestobacter sp. DSM 44400]
MTGPEHDQVRLSLGSYVLGALSPAERAEIDRHLPGCPQCREELASYAGLPGLMGRLSAAQVREDTLVPSPALLERTLSAVASERRATDGRLRRWRAATAASTALAVSAAAVAAAAAIGGAGNPAAGDPMSASPGTPASGAAALLAKPWGTAVSLDLEGLPSDGTFTAWVTADDGRRTQAATWGATPDGRATLEGATSLHREDLASVAVMAADGTILLHLDA